MVKTIITRQLWEGQGGAVLHKGFIAFYLIYPKPQSAALETEVLPSLGDTWSPKDTILGIKAKGVEDVPCKNWLEENDL